MEIWKDIAGYEGMYQVSSEGRVRSLDRIVGYKHGMTRNYPGKILAPAFDGFGYQFVVLCKKNKHNIHKVHRLVASAFIPNHDLFATTVNHKNENKADNRVENLEWMSGADNTRYSQRDGGPGDFRGGRSHRAKSVQCVETGEVYEALTLAADAIGVHQSSLCEAIKKGGRSGGYHWKYIN